ncbi:hypothetical protein I302_107191 [Kwoniella bestiolae CBS 10118]|uniref:Alkaline phosphatase D n=1 Tax=Kwoniella bestiolae CBS 10118 TaxID=1296100 RepID=A0A1B9FZ90_9TREE|nr:alkaline phosphatase D [Kwoniella bestiolae CBS 10118]OCF24086.1 alkaline phosphatase D [Kwoniella bestiolae CBS 10118]
MERLLRLACIGSSLSTKWHAYVFLRLLPSGPVYLPIIYTSATIYVLSFILSRTLLSSKTTRRSNALAKAISLLGGTYDAQTPSISWAGFVITLLAPLCCVDLVYRTHIFYPQRDLGFSRVGWVTEDSANILIRVPHSGRYKLTYGPTSHPGIVLQLPEIDDSTDYTIPITLQNLQADTEYLYSLGPETQGSFTTARKAEEIDKFTILSTSCLKPGWPYNPFTHPLKVDGFTHLDNAVKKMDRKPEAMLFLGDFICEILLCVDSDLPAPVSEYTTSYYRQLYRQVYSSPSWTSLIRSIPWIHMFDDHEIINDFSPVKSYDGQDIHMFENAMEPYISYQRSVNPGPINPRQPTYFSYEIGRVSFFVLDNRSYRSKSPVRPGVNSTAGHGDQSMLGEQQLRDVMDWINIQGRKEGRLLVLVSGVPATRNWSEGKDELDSWAGYLDEREFILEQLWSVGGAVIISGDRHEHATTLIPPPSDSEYQNTSSVIEFSTSPLSFFHLPWDREYTSHPPTDIPLHHQWEGDSRFGIFDFDTSDSDQPKVEFELVVDGEEEWRFEWTKGVEVEIPERWTAVSASS